MAGCQIDIAIRNGGLTGPGRPSARAAGARHEGVSWGMPANRGRRAFLVAALALAGAGRLPADRKRPDPKTRLILLGTGGGPRPRKLRSAPAQVIVANDTAYVVDCGDGVARQLVLASVL
jgi:hypothetical protein